MKAFTDMEYNDKEYRKVQFFFTKEEMVRMTTMDTVSQMGEMAKILINNMINNVCLPRAKVQNSPDNRVEYDLATGSFFVYIPKELCTNCHIRKAVYQTGDQKLCESCQTKKVLTKQDH